MKRKILTRTGRAEIDIMGSKRLYSLDIIKIIAMYLVCFYHFGTVNYNFKHLQGFHLTYDVKYFFSGLSSISVPLFLMVNGALLLNKSYDIKRHLLKIGSIFGLYLLWGATTLYLEAPLFGDHYTWSGFMQAVFSARAGRLDHLWFLQVLAYIYMLFPVLKAVFDKNDSRLTFYLTGLIFLFTFGIVLLQDVVNTFNYVLKTELLPFNIVESVTWLSPFGMYFPHALVYFLLGGWLVKKREQITIKPVYTGIILLLSWSLLFLYGIWKTNTGTSVYDMSFESNKLIMPFIMTISMFLLCLKININSPVIRKIVYTISSNSLGFYLIHVPLGVWLTHYYYQLGISKYFIADLLYVCLLIAIAIAVSVLIKQIPLLKTALNVKPAKSEAVLRRLSPAIVALRRKRNRISA